MRFSKLFGKTLREAPGTVTRTAEQLAMRAALEHWYRQPAGYLPLGVRVLNRIGQITSQALEGLGGQLSSLIPVAIKPYSILNYKSYIVSYRDLPRLIYNPARNDSFFIDLLATEEAFETSYRDIYQALVSVMQNCGVTVSAVEAGPGGTIFVVPHPEARRRLLICTSSACGYCSTEDFAEFKASEGVNGEMLPLTKIETPHSSTIADLAAFLKFETRQTIKAVLYTNMTDADEFVFVVIRGDLEVSEAKLKKVLGAYHLQPATEAEILATGAVPGYASPAGLNVAMNSNERGKGKVTVVADHSIEMGTNFVAGANEAGYHFLNVNYPRDFQVTMMADIAQAQIGSECAQCGEPLRGETAFVVGGCQNAGATELTYLSKNGRPEPVWLGNFWLSPEAILLSVIDQHHDEAGIIWPKTIAPYDIHLVRLGKAQETLEAADKLYGDLQATGKTVFYDDRDEASPGVKFADADLIGLPLRVTVSDKGLKAGTVELKRRDSTEKATVAVGGVLAAIRAM